MAEVLEHLRYETDGPLAIVTLNRPDRLNALTGQTMAEIGEALARLAADDSVTVGIVTGAGRGFCAGGDRKETAAKLARGEEFVGKELNFESLNDAATEVRAYYRSRGYFLAQAYLPEQTIRGGVVEIAIVEGRWGVIELDRKPAPGRVDPVEGVGDVLRRGARVSGCHGSNRSHRVSLPAQPCPVSARLPA